MNRIEWTQALKLLDVGIDERAEFRCDATPGLAIAQDPPPGTRLRQGVTVVYAAEPMTVAVPPLSGVPRTNIEAALRESMLCVGNQRNEEDDGPVDVVMRQSPAAGAPVRSGTRVDVVLRVPRVVRTMPNVVGTNRAQWSAALEPLGVQISERDELRCGATPEVVLRQNPTAGTAITTGQQVVLYAMQAITVTVPSLTGQPRAGVEKVLRESRLCVGNSRNEVGAGTANVVVKQSPEPGSRAGSGSSVDVVVRTSPKPAPTPTGPGPARPGTRVAPPAHGIGAGGAGLIAVIAAAALILAWVLRARFKSKSRDEPRRHAQLPKEVTTREAVDPPRTSIESRPAEIVDADVELRPIRSAAAQSIQQSGPLVSSERKLS